MLNLMYILVAVLWSETLVLHLAYLIIYQDHLQWFPKSVFKSHAFCMFPLLLRFTTPKLKDCSLVCLCRAGGMLKRSFNHFKQLCWSRNTPKTCKKCALGSWSKTPMFLPNLFLLFMAISHQNYWILVRKSNSFSRDLSCCQTVCYLAKYVELHEN